MSIYKDTTQAALLVLCCISTISSEMDLSAGLVADQDVYFSEL